MILWTIQPIEVYELIQKQGYYICDEKKSELISNFDFDKPYDWLVKEMKKKIGNPPLNVKYPVWAWHTWNKKRHKPDLRVSHATRGTKLVCLEIEIPDEDVVLSDFDNWHCVLNDWYLPQVTSEEEFDKAFEIFEKLSKEEQETIKKKSWELIFDIEYSDKPWQENGSYIQATFWKLSITQIKKVQFFTSK